jgi:phosphoribosylamine--glycine ligase
MNVLLIGGGGREHAIAWKLRKSPRLTDLYVAPGNAGTAAIAQNVSLPLPRTGSPRPAVDAYLDAAVQTASDLKADIVFVAPDDPLAWGLVDRLEAAGIAAFGPSAAAAKLEASKAWAKGFMARHSIPNPRVATFVDPAAARHHVRTCGYSVVVKADGLAAGKGAIVTANVEEALQAIDDLMVQGIVGEAGKRVVIEERIGPREVSGHAFCDGRTLVPMPLSCDHKSVFDGGAGPNTGGMGVYSPPWWATPTLADEITERILRPAAAGMAAEGTPFHGVLYPGVMATEQGPQVFEFNARFGDPEAQALLPRLKSDLLEIVWAAVNQRLHEVEVEWDEGASVCLVLASGGYPGEYATGLPLSGLDDLDADVQAFHAGTRVDDAGRLVTAGGRVLGITATAPTLSAARLKAYSNAARVHFSGMHYRRDIGSQQEEQRA